MYVDPYSRTCISASQRPSAQPRRPPWNTNQACIARTARRPPASEWAHHRNRFPMEECCKPTVEKTALRQFCKPDGRGGGEYVTQDCYVLTILFSPAINLKTGIQLEGASDLEALQVAHRHAFNRRYVVPRPSGSEPWTAAGASTSSEGDSRRPNATTHGGTAILVPGGSTICHTSECLFQGTTFQACIRLLVGTGSRRSCRF